jgi:GAF domain-containing protein
LMVADVQAHPDITPYRKRRAAEAGINAVLCVPVRARHQVIGGVIAPFPRSYAACCLG